jgi:hypothetical protein
MANGRYHWSHGANYVRLGFISAFSGFPILLVILHPAWWTATIVAVVIPFLIWVEIVKKMTLPAFFRSINIVLTGRIKSSINLFKELTR